MMPRPLKLSLYIAITVPLMGMEIPGCVSSQIPLSDREEGFIDAALLGSWGTVIDGDGIDLTFTVNLDDDGDLILTLPTEDGERVYSGYSSTLGGRRYLNAKFEECSTCSPEDLEDLTGCPYFSLRYTRDLTNLDLPPDLHEEIERELDQEEWFRRDRTRLFLQLMNPEIVESAIESGAIEGFVDSGVICITDTQEMLRDLVLSSDGRFFHNGPEPDYHLWLLPFVRLTPADLRELNEIRVEFGILERYGSAIEPTTTIPLSFCENFRFGFAITASDRIFYDYEVIHEFPTMPSVVVGEVLDPGPPVRIRGSSGTDRGSRTLSFLFDEGDPTGAYRSELYINGELSAGIDYTVIAPENPDECEYLFDQDALERAEQRERRILEMIERRAQPQ